MGPRKRCSVFCSAVIQLVECCLSVSLCVLMVVLSDHFVVVNLAGLPNRCVPPHSMVSRWYDLASNSLENASAKKGTQFEPTLVREAAACVFDWT